MSSDPKRQIPLPDRESVLAWRTRLQMDLHRFRMSRPARLLERMVWLLTG